MPWDPIKDYTFMRRHPRSNFIVSRGGLLKPVICKVHGFAVAGGSGI